MARAKSTDFIHNFRFHVTVSGIDDTDLLNSVGQKPSAGFNAVSTPEVSQDAVEYREGHFVYTQKFVGLPTVSDITLSRGVALTDGSFWQWMRDVIEQGTEYRADLSIIHFHRDMKPNAASLPGVVNPSGLTSIVVGGPDIPGYIEYLCFDCFPIRFKPSSDLDATASEVSIKELDIAVERFDVKNHGPREADV